MHTCAIHLQISGYNIQHPYIYILCDFVNFNAQGDLKNYFSLIIC